MVGSLDAARNFIEMNESKFAEKRNRLMAFNFELENSCNSYNGRVWVSNVKCIIYTVYVYSIYTAYIVQHIYSIYTVYIVYIQYIYCIYCVYIVYICNVDTI